MAKKKPRAMIDKIPVWCAHDELIDCVELKPNPKNPNTHPSSQIELLSKIIREQGWRMPITVSKRSGLIVKGHGRLEAAFKAGISKAPVDFQDYESEDMEHADMVADNKLAELAKMDDKALENLIREMSKDVLELTALDEDELSNIFAGREPDAEKPEVEFNEELLEEHNYLILYFNNTFDWQVAKDVFGVKVGLDLYQSPAQIKKGNPRKGEGRVLRGIDALKKMGVV